MHAEVQQDGSQLFVRLLQPRLEGDNHIVDALKEYVGSTPDLVELDFSKVTYMNSRGITELVSLYRLFDNDVTKLRFINVKGRVRHVMDLVELHHIADIPDA